ncbi:MAG: DUF881 domain-containing protein [Bacillota bacterium]
MILLGLLLSILYKNLQSDFKYMHYTEVYNIKTKLEENQMIVENLKNQKDNLKKEIKQYEDNENIGSIISSIDKKIKKIETFSGLRPVEGEGVVIIIDDSESLLNNREGSSLIVHDFDIQNILIDLKNAGAEAISVNNERVVVGKSKIKCTGPTIQINQKVTAQPFIIKAIGDRFHLKSAVNSPDGYASVLKDWDIFVEVNTSVNVNISEYKGKLGFKYLEKFERNEK